MSKNNTEKNLDLLSVLVDDIRKGKGAPTSVGIVKYGKLVFITKNN